MPPCRKQSGSEACKSRLKCGWTPPQPVANVAAPCRHAFAFLAWILPKSADSLLPFRSIRLRGRLHAMCQPLTDETECGPNGWASAPVSNA